MNIPVGENMFRLRQFTGIPFTRLAEIAAFIAYKLLRENPEFRTEIIECHSIRSPERQIEIDVKKGYQKITD